VKNIACLAKEMDADRLRFNGLQHGTNASFLLLHHLLIVLLASGDGSSAVGTAAIRRRQT